MPKKIDSIYYTEEQLFRENIKTIDRIMSKEMSLQKESGTVKLHLDLSPSCQVKTIDGKPLDFIPEVKIPSLQKESESKCVRIHPKNSVCIGCPGAYEEYLASETTERIEWELKFQEKVKENKFVTPSSHLNVEEIKSFIRETLANREKEIAEEVKKLYSLDYMKGSPASYINRALDKVLQILKH